MIDAWNERFALEDRLVFDAGAGGLPRVRIATALGTCEIYLQGAQVTAWQPAGHEPVLWLSDANRFVPGGAIRGGVPICWPWFGANYEDPKQAAHGFARNREFQVQRTFTADDGAVGIELGLETDAATRRAWPHDSRAVCTVVVGETLSIELAMTNTDVDAVTYTGALHTYLAVGDVARVGIDGLTGVEYLDKPEGFARKTQVDAPVIDGEVDRIYLDAAAAVTVADPVLRRTLQVEKIGSSTTVLWNPGPHRQMADMDATGFRGMLCVESANAATDAVTLAPGERHVLGTVLRVAATG